jgi:hypothetical protein
MLIKLLAQLVACIVLACAALLTLSLVAWGGGCTERPPSTPAKTAPAPRR